MSSVFSGFGSLFGSSGGGDDGKTSQSQSTGSGWTYTLYYTPDAKDLDDHPIKVKDKKLKSYFARVCGTDDEILEIWIFKQKLFGAPKLAGFWHEFVVVESSKWYWSFEKDANGICVQRSKSWKAVKERYRGESRSGVEDEGRGSAEGSSGDTIQDIIAWIYKKDYLNEGYHVTESNCQYFASELFDAVAREKGKEL